MTLANNFLFFVLIILALGFTTLGLIYRHAILYTLAAAAWGLNLFYVIADPSIGFAGTGLPLATFFGFAMVAMIACMVWLRNKKEDTPPPDEVSHIDEIYARIDRYRKARNRGNSIDY